MFLSLKRLQRYEKASAIQKKSEDFFLLLSVSTFGVAKGTKKRAQYKRKVSFSLLLKKECVTLQPEIDFFSE